MDLRLQRRLHFVPRWVVMPVLRKQSVAEHSYGVACIARWLCWRHVQRDDPGFVASVLESALDHDEEEARTGDKPSPIKEPPVINQNDQVGVLVKVADLLEALVFIHEEQRMGNQMGTDEIRRYVTDRLGDWWNAFNYDGVDKPYAGLLISDVINEVYTPRSMHPVQDHLR